MKGNDPDETEDISITLENGETGEEQTFIWDKRKEAETIKERGITFEAAALVFFDESKISRFDIKHDDKEDRFQTIGQTVGFSGEILFVISTEQDLDPSKPIRIISVRKAKGKEVKAYYRQNDILNGIREAPRGKTGG